MKLPNVEAAIVDRTKVYDYLLSSIHPIGRFKAVFFGALGYTQGRWEDLARDLRVLAQSGDVRLGERNAYGQKYIVRGNLTGPSGRSGNVVTVWIVLNSEDVPRFVTAHPGGD
jgi:uncharacterized protein DUF6883